MSKDIVRSGQYNASAPTLLDKQIELLQLDANGKLKVVADLSAVDIQIGAVELKDGDTDTRADIELDSTKNALFVQSQSLAKEAGGNLATLAGKDFATQTTLALIKAKTDNLDTALSGIKTGTDKIPALPATEGKQDTGNTSLSTVATNTTKSTTPTIYNVTITLANTEYSQALPANTKKFAIKLRSNTADLKYAFVATQSGTNYRTIPAGSEKSEDNLILAAVTLYFQSSTASQTAEIESWT